MGRTRKWVEKALHAGTEILDTTKSQPVRVQMIKTILDYDIRQRECAAKNHANLNKAAGSKRSENQRRHGSRIEASDA